MLIIAPSSTVVVRSAMGQSTCASVDHTYLYYDVIRLKILC